MSEEILMNITPMETRVALVENGVLQELFIERQRSRGLVGNIYLGQVVRVLPGMQAAFVDVGLEKASYLHASDVYSAKLEEGSVSSTPDIRDLVKEGDTLLVQVVKDPMGTKGARLSSYLSLTTRNLVYLPQSDHIGVSTRVDDEEVRTALKAKLLESLQAVQQQYTDTAQTGYIIRTAAEGLEAEDFVNDIRYLRRLWLALQRKIEKFEAPSLIYSELALTERVLRDNVYAELERIRLDDSDVFSQLCEFAEEFVPEYLDKIEFYTAERPIFDLFSVEEEIDKALGRKVELKSGGYLIIDQTEAMTTIDINTGAFVGKRNLEETIFKTNLEAAVSLARQLRLRNLGGIVIVDFIDMKSAEHQRQVLRTLEKATSKDRVKTYVGGFSKLGLVEMTRMRNRESLEHVLCETCAICDARGSLRSPETVCADIFREILRAARAYDNTALLVVASQPIIDRLLDEDSSSVADLQDQIGKTIQFQVDPLYTQEQYDVVFL